MAAVTFSKLLKIASVVLLASGSLYFVSLCMLATSPALQTHVFYLHRLTLTWFKDLAIPEQFGFAPHQVNSFFITTKEDRKLHAWHVLPLGVYRRNLNVLLLDDREQTGEQTGNGQLELLRSDPNARLVVYLHGTAGCIASGWRPDSYRAMYAAAPDHIHVLAFDYRGYGLSSGIPSENGLLEDGISIIEWALETAKIPASRIVIYGQSLGTAVALALMQHYAALPEPIYFAGHVLTASFSDVATLTATYRIGGVIPILSPLRKVPFMLAYLNSFLTNTWMSKDRMTEYITLRETSTDGQPYHIDLVHAEDDSDIACQHSDVLFWHAVNASSFTGVTREELHSTKQPLRVDRGHGGWIVEHRTERGTVRQIRLLHGKHDRLMSFPITSLAVLQAFEAGSPVFTR